jgi:hypothetical protein
MEKKSHISPAMRAMLGQETILKASEPMDAGNAHGVRSILLALVKFL